MKETCAPLPMPYPGILACQTQVEAAIADARLDHATFVPFVEGADGDPVGMAGQRGLPADAIGGAAAAGHDVADGARPDARVVVARLDARRPEFRCAVRPI